MPLVTKILYKQGKNKDRVYVYIDEKFCTSVRERTWVGMDIREGTRISCEALKVFEQNWLRRQKRVKSNLGAI